MGDDISGIASPDGGDKRYRMDGTDAEGSACTARCAISIGDDMATIVEEDTESSNKFRSVLDEYSRV